MAPTSCQVGRIAPNARRRRTKKADDELFSIIVCVAVLLKLLATRKVNPLVRHRISWSVHADMLLREKQFGVYYRMRYSSFHTLLRIVSPYLVVDYYQSLRRSRGIPPLSPAGMLQCALSWLGGGSYHHIRIITGISRAAFYRVIYRVMFAINDAEELSMHFPKTQVEMEAAAAAFQTQSNQGIIEGCIGVIDGWLRPIRVPRKGECGRVISFFSGHYQKYGLNVQACADYISRFVSYSVKSPGGTNDSYAFRRWKLSHILEDIVGPYYIIGDNAYVQSRTLKTPFNQAQLEEDPIWRDSYNFHVSQLRIRVEMAFGLLVNKWRILQRPLQVRLRNCNIVISACMRLHNFCITQRCASTPAPPKRVLKSMINEVRFWNDQETVVYDSTAMELNDGSRVDLMDEKVLSDLVRYMAIRNVRRPQRNIARRVAEAEEKT